MGKELLAFVDSGALQVSCTEYALETTSMSQSGVEFKGANGPHIKHYGQRRFRVKTSAGSNMNTTWEVADVRKPLISASRLLERGHKLALDEKPRIQETQFRLRGPVVCPPYGCEFRRVFTGRAEHEPHQEKRARKTTHTEGRTRNTHAVWPVTDASDRTRRAWCVSRALPLLVSILCHGKRTGETPPDTEW